MCKMCMEGMLNSLNTDIHDCYRNKWKRSRPHLIKKMMKQKTKRAIDFSTCNHDTKEGFQEESDFTYLKKSYRYGLRKAGKAHSLIDKNCMKCCTPLLPVHEGGDVN